MTRRLWPIMRGDGSATDRSLEPPDEPEEIDERDGPDDEARECDAEMRRSDRERGIR
jgi:hypothetical protein